MSDLDEFGKELSNVKMDTKMEWAAVEDVEVSEKYEAMDAVDLNDPGGSDDGIQITYQMASGQRFVRWYAKPSDWNRIHDLVLLLDFWGVHPGEIERLEDDDETFEVPLKFVQATDEWKIDWQEIERTIHTRQLEAQGDE